MCTDSLNKRPSALLHTVFCIWIQAISVLPHHHHAEFVCMSADVPATHSHRATVPCPSGCATHFNLTAAPDISFTESVSSLKSAVGLFFVIALFFLYADRKTEVRAVVSPVFYLKRPRGVSGLRAPPFV